VEGRGGKGGRKEKGGGLLLRRGGRGGRKGEGREGRVRPPNPKPNFAHAEPHSLCAGKLHAFLTASPHVVLRCGPFLHVLHAAWFVCACLCVGHTGKVNGAKTVEPISAV